MARYHQVAAEIGPEVEAFANQCNLTPEQRVALVQLLFNSTRIASGGRLQFSTRVNSYHIIARHVSGVVAKTHRVKDEDRGKNYESIRFELADMPDQEEE